jgi:putative addiction module component (TIGR02574 family)
MNTLAEKIYETALDLPAEERILLIDKLLHSTNLPTKKFIDEAWSKEVDHRLERLNNGTAKLIPGNEVFAKIKSQFTAK